MDYLLVLDFEATCDESEDQLSRQAKDAKREIIEFPVVKLNARTGVIEAEFHAFVKPTDAEHRKLSEFCTKLTGIQQAQVDAAKTLVEVLIDFDRWITAQQLGSYCFVTCGDWDLKDMLPTEAKRKGIELKPYLRNVVNVKDVFSKTIGGKTDMPGMLHDLGLPLQGHLHSGRDDARNIAQICAALLRKGADFSKPLPSGPTRRPGDWDCPTCGKLVFGSKGSCFVCDSQKKFANDWTCPQCKASVFGSKSSCYKCGTPNPAPPKGRNDWICPKCNALVFGSRAACFKCGQRR